MFIGRKTELKRLTALFSKKSASLIVVRGRRRIGKSCLIQEFGKQFPKFLEFSGLPPTRGTTAQSQKEEFSRQMKRQLGIPAVRSDDWGDLFCHLAHRTQKGRVLIFFDEVTWMGSKDPLFLGKLKNAWDQQFKKNPQLIFVLCGSISQWIDENILSSTGFLGRISLDLILTELPLSDCALFWGRKAGRIASHELFKVLAVTGGVPRYLEEIRPHVSSEENIRQLCFQPGGILVNEFDQIFSDLFNGRAPLYKKIAYLLTRGALTREMILKGLRISKGGNITKCLEDLEKAGFISRDYTWQFYRTNVSKLSHYRLRDNYLRFYLRYIQPQLGRINSGSFEYRSLFHLPGWESIMGLQFENLVLHNRKAIQQKLRLTPDEIISDNPFFQTKNQTQPGCQIDYLIHAKYNTLFVCEMKFARDLIAKKVIQEVQQKMNRLKIPKQFTMRPVLIHEGPLHPEVVESDFFDRIIDFADLLQE